ncbi:hypothetical protein OsI_12471 [Oryza sativa Indica Group]|uniref:Uncharacterized protein n=1 Tax=Oryza sativa subsp. indica TaxID=39946 RepID=A2XJ54_ORYSI|nr:hypothetical protein OsI_12471 [Oryza sativa Indica Group]
MAQRRDTGEVRAAAGLTRVAGTVTTARATRKKKWPARVDVADGAPGLAELGDDVAVV